jgi:heat shock protein HtpX
LFAPHREHRTESDDEYVQNHAAVDCLDDLSASCGRFCWRAKWLACGYRTRCADEFCFVFLLRQNGTRHLPGTTACARATPPAPAHGGELGATCWLARAKGYLIANDSTNAFATGRNPRHASVAVPQGLLSLLSDEELEGVLAHELGHVHKRDILISSIAATLAGAITLLAKMGSWGALFGGLGGRDNDRERGGGFSALLMIILAPIAAMLIELAVSRAREYQADTTGVRFTGNPHALASALKKLDGYSRRVPMAATPATAHLSIVRPMLGAHLSTLFSTHPPIAKRIDRLIGHDGAPGGVGIAYDYQ